MPYCLSLSLLKNEWANIGKFVEDFKNWGTGDSLFGQFSQLEDSKEGQEIVKCLGTQEILSSAAVASKSHCFKRPE